MKGNEAADAGVRAPAATGAKRRATVVAATIIALVGAAGAARAANEPLLELTFPAIDNGVARSQDAVVIFARYDRPLDEHHSTFRLFDNASNPVTGVTFLSEPPGDIKGMRQINFRADPPLTEAASPYTARVKVRARVTLGDTQTTWTFDIDDTAPAAPVVTYPPDGAIITDQQVVVTGTAEPAATVLVIEGGVKIASDVAAADGTFDVFLPYPDEDGVFHTFEVFQRDVAGNTGPGTGPITIYHDSIELIPIILTPPEGAFLNTLAVTVSGTAKPGSTVRLREGGPIIATTPVNAGGEWSVVVPFANGPHSITAEAFDGVMVDGPSSARAFTVDTVAPAAPVINTPAPAAILSTTSVLITGTAEADGRVRILHNAIVRATVPVDGAGAWSATLSFTQGTHTIEARAIDRAGNVGPAATRTFTVDSIAPAAPVINAPSEGSFLNSNVVAVTGVAEPNATVDVLVGTVVIGSAPVGGGGAWAINLPFADGTHSITAVTVDGAGNRSPASPLRSFTVDTVAPLAPVILDPGEGELVQTSTVTVAGTAEPATVLEIWEGLLLLGTTDVDSEGNWSIDLPFADGAHAITARAIDLATNAGPFSTVRSFTVNAIIDNTAPAAPILVHPAEASLKPGWVIFEGTAENNSTVRIYEGASEIASGTAAGGFFRFGAPMLAGVHAVTATATDGAGNESAPTGVRTFTVDNQRPVVTVETANGTIFLAPLQPILIDGEATDNHGVASVEVEYRPLAGGSSVEPAGCIGCPGASVSWDHSPALLPGLYDVTVTAVDVVGNRSVPVTIDIIVL